MDIDKILNLQYRKLLTKKEELVSYLETALKYGNTLIDITDIEVLALFLIDLDNLNYPSIDNNDNDLLKDYINNLLNDNVYDQKENDINVIKKIYDLSKTHRITDELNKKIALGYAKYINTQEDNYLCTNKI